MGRKLEKGRRRNRSSAPEASGGISRSTFVRGSIVAISLSVSGFLLTIDLGEDDGQQEGFPKSLRGCGKIEPHTTPGAKRWLVHIRQTHMAADFMLQKIQEILESFPVLLDSDKEEIFSLIKQHIAKRIRNSQQDIHEMMQDLHGRDLMDTVYHEGVTDVANIEVLIATHARVEGIRRNLRARLATMTDFEERANLEQTMQALDAQVDTLFAQHGPWYKMIFSRKVAMRPGEDADLHAATADAVKRGDQAAADELHEQREFALIKRCATDPDQSGEYSFFVFGDNHDFLNQLQKWNDMNPDNRRNLLVCTPESHQRCHDATAFVFSSMSAATEKQLVDIHWWRNMFQKADAMMDEK